MYIALHVSHYIVIFKVYLPVAVLMKVFPLTITLIYTF